MKRLAAALLGIFILFSGLSPVGAATLFSKVIEIQITHSHEHSDETHSHDFNSSSEAESKPLSYHGNNPDVPTETHSHTITIVSSGPSLPPQRIAITFDIAESSNIFRAENQIIPANRSLGSIFRPPIRA